MTPIEFVPVVDQCQRVTAAGRDVYSLLADRPDGLQEPAAADAIALCRDVMAIVTAAQQMLRRPQLDGRGAVVRRIVEAAMIASMECAAAIELWGPSAAQWLVFARECEQCRDVMRDLLALEVHDSGGEMSGAT